MMLNSKANSLNFMGDATSFSSTPVVNDIHILHTKEDWSRFESDFLNYCDLNHGNVGQGIKTGHPAQKLTNGPKPDYMDVRTHPITKLPLPDQRV